MELVYVPLKRLVLCAVADKDISSLERLQRRPNNALFSQASRSGKEAIAMCIIPIITLIYLRPTFILARENKGSVVSASSDTEIATLDLFLDGNVQRRRRLNMAGSAPSSPRTNRDFRLDRLPQGSVHRNDVGRQWTWRRLKKSD